MRGRDRGSVGAALALAFAAAAVTTLAGVVALDLPRLSIAPVLSADPVPDASWPARWLPGAVSAAEQQQAAAQQWLHVVLVFGALTAAIAAANALIHLLQHGNERRFETAVKALVGAPRRRLEHELLRHAAAVAAVGVTAGVSAGMLMALAASGTRHSPASWALLAVLLSAGLAVAAVRITAARFEKPGWMGDALAPEARTVPGWGAEDLRNVFAAAQLACAAALAIVSLLVWSYAADRTADTTAVVAGTVSVARVSLPASMPAAERRRAHAGIRGLAAGARTVESESIASPGALLGTGKVDKVISDCGPCGRAGLPLPIFPLETQHHVIATGFFRTAGIALLRGRDFDGSDADRARVIVNQSFARAAFQGQDGIGKRIMVGGFNGEWYRVIGIVDDVRTTGLRFLSPDPAAVVAEPPAGRPPAIYFSTAAYAPAVFDVVVRTRAGTPGISGFAFESLPHMLARARAPQDAFTRALTLLAGLMCGAVGVGSFLVTALNVRARRPEIAVRRAAGARRRDVWWLVYGSTLANAGRGVVMGVIASVALSRAFEPFVPGLPPFSATGAVVVCAALLAIVLAATFVPLYQALRSTPAQVLH